MDKIVPSDYPINLCIFHRLYLKQKGFLLRDRVAYSLANILWHLVGEISQLQCDAHRVKSHWSKWSKTFLWQMYISKSRFGILVNEFKLVQNGCHFADVRISWIKNEAILRFFKFLNLKYMVPVATVQCPQTMSNLSNLRCWSGSGVGKSWKCKISAIKWVWIKTNSFLFRSVAYHMRWCNGHSTAVINNGQSFKFVVSNSASKTQFSKHSENPSWHNGYNRVVIVDFCLMTKTKAWFTIGQLHHKVTMMKQDFFGIGPKSAISSTLRPLRHCEFTERLQNCAFRTELDTANLISCPKFSDTEPWPLH